MAELSVLRGNTEAAGRRIRTARRDGSGDTRRSLDSATRQVRATLEAATKEFLSLNHPPGRLQQIRHIVYLIRREFVHDRQLGREVANALRDTSQAMHPLDNVFAPPLPLVQYWLSVAHRFLDALEPILAERNAAAEEGR